MSSIMNNLRRVSLLQSIAVSLKLIYDSRRTYQACCNNSRFLKIFKDGLAKLFVMSVALIEIDPDMPEECLAFLTTPPERKFLVVGNLKMNGTACRLDKYCETLNQAVVCVPKSASKTAKRQYRDMMYPDLVDYVIAPPFPYLEQVSNKLRKDCIDCRGCASCTDCSPCEKCGRCDDCQKCAADLAASGGASEPSCCKSCLNFDKCNIGGSCRHNLVACKDRKCECEDCGVCEFCQNCYRDSCDDCGTCIQTAGQNSFPFLKGGMSGEVSPRQMHEMGARWVIVGSSERRLQFQESTELLVHKLRCALFAKMKVLYCVSDTSPDGGDNAEIEAQLRAAIPRIGLGGVDDAPPPSEDDEVKKYGQTNYEITDDGIYAVKGSQDWENVAIAYEPVWALKTGVVPTADQVEAKCEYIRNLIKQEAGEDIGHNVRIIYGGPVEVATSEEIAIKPNVDGFLLGTISFKVEQFIYIANAWFIKYRSKKI